MIHAHKQARRDRDARRGRLGRGRYDRLVQEIAKVITLAFEAGATASLWGLEGPLRHAIRSDLCLQGWRWLAADDMSRGVLEDAFKRVGAKRPSWNEGQREWSVEGGGLIERAYCAGCAKPLLDGRPKYCDDHCRKSHYQRMARRKAASEAHAVHMAITRD